MRFLNHVAAVAAGLGLIAFRLNTIGFTQSRDFKPATIETTPVAEKSIAEKSIAKEPFPEAVYVITGDIYLNKVYPATDASNGDSSAGMIDAGVIDETETLLALEDKATIIISGHGPLSNQAELEAYRMMLENVRLRTE
ncbi:MAG: hypothetical protein AAF703_20215 [Cyanobacteria bacterium P01_D01_bin.105]